MENRDSAGERGDVGDGGMLYRGLAGRGVVVAAEEEAGDGASNRFGEGNGGGEVMRAFYKSRLFWCGVPGLVFLLWVWWDSGRHYSEVTWYRGSEERDVRVYRGVVEWRSVVQRLFIPGTKQLFVDRHEMVEVDKNGLGFTRECGFDLPAGFRREEKPDDDLKMTYEAVEVSVALWLIAGCYAAMWLGAVFAWRWRKRRVMRRLTETEVVG
ncbi:hypothetical protein [Luteolibacter soli]|uniref:DUF3592 domain-containing protein n=1 Tax=Luteolibacter soli TaxID=3135280 RepID=A0ABU9AVF4_9BACT